MPNRCIQLVVTLLDWASDRPVLELLSSKLTSLVAAAPAAVLMGHLHFKILMLLKELVSLICLGDLQDLVINTLSLCVDTSGQCKQTPSLMPVHMIACALRAVEFTIFV